MPALDQYHDAVRNALLKEGWTITHDPLTLTVRVDRLHVDLGAERVIAAEKGIQKIAVEIKTFAGNSKINALEAATGQYVVYRVALRRQDQIGFYILLYRKQCWSTFFKIASYGKPASRKRTYDSSDTTRTSRR